MTPHRNRRGRGLTLIELLAALALLGMLTIALASWTQTTLRVSARTSREQPWLSAADAALARIGEDLLVGDFEPPPPGRGKSTSVPPRVVASANRLVITTREVGAVLDHAYILERFRHRLVRRSGDSQSLLLGDVGEFNCSVDDEKKLLTVTIASTTGLIRTRRFALP